MEDEGKWEIRVESGKRNSDHSRRRPGIDQRLQIRRLQIACGVQLRTDFQQRRLFARTLRSTDRNGFRRRRPDASHRQRVRIYCAETGIAAKGGRMANLRHYVDW